MVALGRDLSADQEIYLTGLHGSHEVGRSLRSAESVTGHDSLTGVGPEAFCFFRHPLHAGPAGSQRVFRFATRAAVGKPYGVAAVMALKAADQAVLDQPCAAQGTFDPMAAAPAKGQRRVATPVQEQHGLLAFGESRGNRAAQRCRQPALSGRSRNARMAQGYVVPQVDDLDQRQVR